MVELRVGGGSWDETGRVALIFYVQAQHVNIVIKEHKGTNALLYIS